MNNKEKIADIILKTNKFEFYLKDIISKYVDSNKSSFFYDIILNNLVINLKTKLRLIKIISYQTHSFTKTESKDFDKSSNIIISKRNQISHSDSLTKDELILMDVDYDWNFDGITAIPMFEEVTPNIVDNLILNTGEIKEESLDKIHIDYIRYYKICLNLILKIFVKLEISTVELIEEKGKLDF